MQCVTGGGNATVTTTPFVETMPFCDDHRINCPSLQMFPALVFIAVLENVVRFLKGKSILRVNDSIASLASGIFQDCFRWVALRSVLYSEPAISIRNCPILYGHADDTMHDSHMDNSVSVESNLNSAAPSSDYFAAAARLCCRSARFLVLCRPLVILLPQYGLELATWDAI